MPIMVTEVTNIKEQLASVKATLDRLLKERAEKDAQIKRQNKQIADLTKKLEKWPIGASNKYSSAEDYDKESNHNEQSNDERKAIKDHSLGSMFVERKCS